MHLAERKRHEVAQVALVGKEPAQRRPRERGRIERAQRRPQRQRHRRCQTAHDAQGEPAGDPSRGIDERQHPAVALARVAPRHEHSARHQQLREGAEAVGRPAQMVQHAQRVDDVHGPRADGGTGEVALHDVDGLEPFRVARRRLHRLAEVEADHVARAELGGQPQVPALAAAAVDHAPPGECVRAHRRDPAEELLAILRPDLGEPRPLVAEALRRRRRLGGHGAGDEPRDAPEDRIARAAAGAHERALSDLSSPPDGVAQAEPAAAGGAGEPLEQALAHQTTR